MSWLCCIRGAQPFARFQGVVEGLLEEPAEVEEVEEVEEAEESE